MKVEVRPYDVAEYLTDREMIFHYLSEELASNEPFYAARALSAVIRARGGVEHLSKETGVTVEALQHAVAAEDQVDRETLLKVIAAFREGSTSSMVA